MKRLMLFVVILGSLLGCTNSDKREEVIKELYDKCEGTLTISYKASSWGDNVTITCSEDMKGVSIEKRKQNKKEKVKNEI